MVINYYNSNIFWKVPGFSWNWLTYFRTSVIMGYIQIYTNGDWSAPPCRCTCSSRGLTREKKSCGERRSKGDLVRREEAILHHPQRNTGLDQSSAVKLQLLRLTRGNLRKSPSSPKRRRQTGFGTVSAVGKTVLLALYSSLQLEGILHDKLPWLRPFKPPLILVYIHWCPVCDVFGFLSHVHAAGVVLPSSFCSHLSFFLYAATFDIQQPINWQTWPHVTVQSFWHVPWPHCFCCFPSLLSLSLWNILCSCMSLSLEWTQWCQQDGKCL